MRPKNTCIHYEKYGQSQATPSKLKGYNGHRSWNAWNVSLWINNEESLYNLAIACLNATRSKSTGKLMLNRATSKYLAQIDHKTPDGAINNRLSVRIALQGIAETLPVVMPTTINIIVRSL